VTGRTWAYAGAVLGGAVSIAANVAHSYVPPPDAPAGWAPLPGAVIGAVFWPVALLLAIEILARVDWPAGLRWVLLRFGGLVPVGAVAAVVSYRHMSGLLGSYHEDWLTARFGPLAVDGLMVMSAGALLALAGAASVLPVAPTLVDEHDVDVAGHGLVTILDDARDEPAGRTYEPGSEPDTTASRTPAWPVSTAGRTSLPLVSRTPVSDAPDAPPEPPPAPRPKRRPKVRPADELARRRTRQPTAKEREIMDAQGVSRTRASEILAEQRRAEGGS
jgi:hypothetical protein